MRLRTPFLVVWGSVSLLLPTKPPPLSNLKPASQNSGPSKMAGTQEGGSAADHGPGGPLQP